MKRYGNDYLKTDHFQYILSGSHSIQECFFICKFVLNLIGIESSIFNLFFTMKTSAIILLFFVYSGVSVFGQKSDFQEYTETIKTYPFSDPNPFPIIERNNALYPYFRFDGFSHTGKLQEWNMVKLENDYIIVYVLPDMGGKLWGAIDKKTGKEFIYKNDAIKFRDVAQRGPWTSGGIEFNSGIIGHHAGGATPVDYKLFTDDEGVAHCVIGGTDLPSRTIWRVDIVVPPGKSWFETKTLWYNTTPFRQAYYYWSNAGVKSSDGLHFYFPGNHWIGHGGDLHPWPVDKEGIDRSWYKNNRDNGSSSYHVIGSIDNYYISFWEDEHFGSGHLSPPWGTPGKKIWLWPQARNGAIWEDLLTDKHGQYVEVQAGRMFNQNAFSSVHTPFKQTSFFPFNSDTWTERWFPISDMDGITRASASGTVFVKLASGTLTFQFCPIREINDPLTISVDGKNIVEENLNIKPQTTFKKQYSNIDGNGEIKIMLGDELLYSSTKDFLIKRPLKSKEDAQASDYILAVELVYRRNYDRALDTFIKYLKKEPADLEALTHVAEIYFYKGQTDQALDYLKQVLELNAYHPWANFLWAVIAKDRGDFTNAQDGFRFAMRSLDYRSASWELLAEMALINKRYEKAADLARKALGFNTRNFNAYKVMAIAQRKMNEGDKAGKTLDRLLAIDPLNHFALFEKSLIHSDESTTKAFTESFHNEMTKEAYLEIGIFYAKLDLKDEAKKVLKLAPEYPVINYWLAWLNKEQKNPGENYLEKAVNADPEFIFPYRMETLKILDWAKDLKPSWKTDYYRALILWNRGRKDDALKCIGKWNDQPDFAPFYFTRAYLEDIGTSAALKDMEKAFSVDPGQWRLYKELAVMHQQRKDYSAALKVIEQGHKKFPGNYILDLVYARTLALMERYTESLKVLEKIHVLPFEGENSAHNVYVNDYLMLSINSFLKKKYNKTLKLLDASELYPENQGSGKPSYPDYRAQYFIRAKVYEKQRKSDLAQKSYDAIIHYKNPNMHGYGRSYNRLAYIFALINTGQVEKGKELAYTWANENKGLLGQWVKAKIDGNTGEMQRLEKELLAKEKSPDRYLTARLIFSLSRLQ